ncbi:hypothetical protein MK079_05330 [Candidatus Gracilibacteria bacterium]|nr:hypothetical protein [Candidatus Gracilibacteria bacterium]
MVSGHVARDISRNIVIDSYVRQRFLEYLSQVGIRQMSDLESDDLYMKLSNFIQLACRQNYLHLFLVTENVCVLENTQCFHPHSARNFIEKILEDNLEDNLEDKKETLVM